MHIMYYISIGLAILIVLILVASYFSLKKQSAICPHYGHIWKPKFLKALFGLHMINEIGLTCPNCDSFGMQRLVKDKNLNKFVIKSIFYNEATLQQRKDIANLLDLVWGDNQADNQANLSSNEPKITHRKQLLAQSFCCYCDEILVGYAAVVRDNIFHCGEKFAIAGLSCVATHPDFRHCGIGDKIVAEATRYITEQKDIDCGIFTCQPELAQFYQNAGEWKACPNVVLIGSHDKGALSSVELNVVVLMKLFSDKAKEQEALFCAEPISLDFPVGEFL